MPLLFATLLAACSEYGMIKAIPADSGETPMDSDPVQDSGAPEVDRPDNVGAPLEEQLDQWNLEDLTRTDLVFFGDTSGSMSVELTTMGSQILTFLDGLSVYTGDWQLMAVTGPDGCGVGGVLTPETPDYATLFANGLLTAPGADEVDEWGLYNVAMAVEQTDEAECNAGFLRDDARLHVVVISDEDDNSPGWDSGDAGYWAEYVDALFARKSSPALVRVSGIIGPVPDGCAEAEPGTGYAEAIEATGGVTLSICEDWTLGIGSLVEATVQHDTFALSRAPQPSTLEVFVNGVERAEGWAYDVTENAVVFSADIPVAGDTVEVTYLVAS